jgi:hypothetical protein
VKSLKERSAVEIPISASETIPDEVCVADSVLAPAVETAPVAELVCVAERVETPDVATAPAVAPVWVADCAFVPARVNSIDEKSW